MSSNKKLKKYIGLGGILFLFPLIWLLFFGVFSKHNFQSMPYFGPEAMQGADSSSYIVPDFAFSDETGRIITRDSLKGQVWLAAFYDLKNEHISKITERLLNVNFKYRNEPDIRIVVFSTDCDYDTDSLRKAYVAQNTRYNSFPHKWIYLCGEKLAMQGFIRNGFLIEDLHNDAIFRLVDAEGHIRGLYGNTEYHFLGSNGEAGMPGIVQDIALLKKEYDLKEFNEKKKKEQ
jgi:cytochrome oxidase Cu insertion factor (SCO1/SenC/PrrC family)